MTRKIIATAAALAMLQACSSRPREFTPTLAPAVDHAGFQAAYESCKQLYVAGKLDYAGRMASGAVGAAAGGATLAAGAAAASSAGLYAGAAVASATIVLIPFVALGGAWGMAKTKQKRKERAIQTAMNGCLTQRGYQVASWARAPKVKAPPAGAP